MKNEQKLFLPNLHKIYAYFNLNSNPQNTTNDFLKSVHTNTDKTVCTTIVRVKIWRAFMAF